jgi:uncharacterized repeat protein (TIGR03803 family)
MLCLALCLFPGTAFAQQPEACSPTNPKPKNSNVRVPDVGKPGTPAGGVADGWVLLYEDDSYQQLSDEVFCKNNKIQFSSSDAVERGNLTSVVSTGKYGNTNTFLWKGDFPFFSVLHTFAGYPNDGAYPNAPLIKDSAGNFYGTTNGHCGTVFKVDPTGKSTVLYNFTGGADGCAPTSGLARDSSGNLYGATYSGGDPSCTGDPYAGGCGVVFKVDTNNVETFLHTFEREYGANPSSGVVLDSSGNLYGVTVYGGAYDYGTVYKLDTNRPSSSYTVLWNFTGGADGAQPREERLLLDSSGNLYGTASSGGSTGYGTVFKVDQSGNETTLYTFIGPPDDGCIPTGALAMDTSGNLYGTTSGCSPEPPGPDGTVWELSGPNEFVMHVFTGGADGGNPTGGVILDASGNVYGGAYPGGAYNNGVLFRITPSGTETVLYDFSGGADGAGPGMPLLDSEGYLWGVAAGGGSSSYGTLWGFDLK